MGGGTQVLITVGSGTNNTGFVDESYGAVPPIGELVPNKINIMGQSVKIIYFCSGNLGGSMVTELFIPSELATLPSGVKITRLDSSATLFLDEAYSKEPHMPLVVFRGNGEFFCSGDIGQTIPVEISAEV